jgi:hypothetical protein
VSEIQKGTNVASVVMLRGICNDKILMTVCKKIKCGSMVCALYVAQCKCLHCTFAAEIKDYVGRGCHLISLLGFDASKGLFGMLGLKL